MDSRRFMISTKSFLSLKLLMPNIGTRWINGKNNTGKKYKTRKKAYPNGYGIIKGKMQTDKQNRFQKAETEGQDDMPL